MRKSVKVITGKPPVQELPLADSPSKYVSRRIPVRERMPILRERAPDGPVRRSGHARIEAEGVAAFGRLYGPSAALLLAIVQWSGTRWVRQREGWMFFDRATRSALGITNRLSHCRADKKLVNAGMIEIRNTPGSRLEYRLSPDWAKPTAEVVDLAAARSARNR